MVGALRKPRRDGGISQTKVNGWFFRTDVSPCILWANLASLHFEPTFIQYCDASTVHGIGYIFERGQAFFPRFAWLLVVIASMTLGLLWSSQVNAVFISFDIDNETKINTIIWNTFFKAYAEWQEHPVLTTVSTTGKPIKDIEFPAITICSQGTIKEV